MCNKCGIKPDPDQVKAIMNLSTISNKQIMLKLKRNT